MSERCEPPEHLRDQEINYWLENKETCRQAVAHWCGNYWTSGEVENGTPEELHENGWRYCRPMPTIADMVVQEKVEAGLVAALKKIVAAIQDDGVSYREALEEARIALATHKRFSR